MQLKHDYCTYHSTPYILFTLALDPLSTVIKFPNEVKGCIAKLINQFGLM